ncbi:MAG: YwaF family protein [Bacilli bacterium]|nr:YwaF family protein [Bacilli bacterium]
MLFADFFTSSGMDENPARYLFKWPHFIYIGLVIISFYVLMKIFVNKDPKVRKIFIFVSCFVLLFLKYSGEALFIIEWYKYGDTVSSYSHPFWDYRTFISFQVCGINNVLLPLVIWFNWKGLKDFVYSTSIIGGIAVMIYPVGVLYGEPFVLTLPIVRSLIVHFLLVFLPCFMIATGDFRLERKNWRNTLIGVLGVMLWGMYGNIFVDKAANNMYLMENPFYGGPVPLLNILPNGLHAAVLILLVFLGFLLVYWVSDKYNQHYDRIHLVENMEK